MSRPQKTRLHAWPRWPRPFPLALAFLPAALGAKEAPATTSARDVVGRIAPNRYILPNNQVLTPSGKQVELPKMRPQALALSPDGTMLIAAGKTSEIVVIDPVSGAIKQRVALPGKKEPVAIERSATQLEADTGAQLSLTGLAFSPDGTRIFLSNTNGDIKVFGVDIKRTVSGLASYPLPPAAAPKRKPEIPAGLAVSKDGTKLYVA